MNHLDAIRKTIQGLYEGHLHYDFSVVEVPTGPLDRGCILGWIAYFAYLPTDRGLDYVATQIYGDYNLGAGYFYLGMARMEYKLYGRREEDDEALWTSDPKVAAKVLSHWVAHELWGGVTGMRLDYRQLNSEQEIFDAVFKAIVAQGPSIRVKGGDIPYTTCSYRDPEGRACAAGVLIPDELYSEEMEGKNARDVLYDPSLVSPGFREWADQFNPYFFDALQYAHDAAARSDALNFEQAYEIVMEEVAANFNLSTAVFDGGS